MLLYLFEQGKKLCPFAVDRFGPLPQPQPAPVGPENETLKKALTFAIPLCQDYADGKITDKDELKRKRDEKFLAEGIPKVRIVGGQPRTKAQRDDALKNGRNITPEPIVEDTATESSEDLNILKRAMGLDHDTEPGFAQSTKAENNHPTDGRRRTSKASEGPQAKKPKTAGGNSIDENDAPASEAASSSSGPAKKKPRVENMNQQ
jgi:hypothetical protein